MERGELAAWLRLALTPGVGNTTARRLLAAFGLPGAIFSQSPEGFAAVVGPAQAKALREEPAGLSDLLEATWQWLHQDDGLERRIIALGDAHYPELLLNTADPPLMLYLMGRTRAPWPQSLAIVGSRNPTAQGLLNAKQFARSFAQSGLTVISGLALGVDGAAHEGALDGAGADTSDSSLATIAVVGTGLDRVYPSRHLALAHRIARSGLIVSEYAIGTPPLPENFPRRNRIIAALSQGTVVVEAALKSGSLITAHQALEMGREVFAIPGSIHSPQSRGCHALLKQGAKLVETAQDVLEELKLPIAQTSGRASSQSAANDESDKPGQDNPLLEALGFDPVSLDALIARTGISASELQARLLELELGDEVARLPGGLFQRIAHA
ncbi:DNA-processing protein DprA [Caenimonas sp. SL110]|uniref:DNA-processing protein DprA n=1 Tax=Caenimonas sp. SL110 TaxID=1450524 RepID=UPI00065411D5|nr:DNA-processing protein DprA [Caenimonas sp. SL110]